MVHNGVSSLKTTRPVEAACGPASLDRLKLILGLYPRPSAKPQQKLK